MKNLWKYFDSRLKNKFIKASFFSFLNKVFDLAPPLLIGLAVDIVVKRETSFLSSYISPEMMPQLYAVAVATLIIWVGESFFEYLFGVEWRTLAQNVQHLLRMDSYQHLQKLQLKYFEDKNTGNLISILNDDVNQLERFLDTGVNEIIQVMTTVVIIGIIFFALAPGVAIYSFIPMPFVILGSFYFQNKIEPKYKKVREEVGLLGEILNNNISGIATIKSYSAERFEAGRLEEQSLNYSKANESAIKLSSAFTPLIRMVILTGFICTLLIGGYYVKEGWLEVGSYSVMVFMTQRLLWPLTRLGQTVDLYQRAQASVDRIFNLLNTPITIQDGLKKLDSPNGEIEFKNINFEYHPGNLVLENINIKIPAGKTVAFVGPTGSGKTTLVKLLLRFYDPTSGTITFDNEDIKNLPLSDLRNLLSYVGQDVYLFHGSVKENIAYALERDFESISLAAKSSESDSFIENLPQKYETIVGERGQKLSGGQRQRITIARAILKDAPVFIFDEATSAVDNETEASIQRSLQRMTKNKTTIIIAHRLSTIINADIIYVLDKGKIVESGTHQELLNNAHIYKNLWKVQFGETVH